MEEKLSQMDDNNDRSESTQEALCHEDCETMKSPKQVGYAWIILTVLGLISIVGFGARASVDKVSRRLQESPPRSPVRTPSRLNTPRPTPRATPRPPSAGGCQMQRYTLANIAQNNDASKCWVSLYGVVYDLTEFVGRHRGGPVIIGQCGKDATTRFDRQHGVSLLREEGFSSSIIGRLGSSRGVQTVPCNQVNWVAVTGTRRE